MKKKKIESHCCLAFSASTPPNPPAPAASSLRTTLYQSPLFVTLLINSVSIGGQVWRRKAMAQSFKALLVASVEGVVVKVWWGLVERDEPRVYNWQRVFGPRCLSETMRFEGPCCHGLSSVCHWT